MSSGFVSDRGGWCASEADGGSVGSCVGKLLDVAVRLHTIEHRMPSELDVESCTVTMLSTLAAEPRIWAHEGLWSGIFYEGFTATVVRSQLANPGDAGVVGRVGRAATISAQRGLWCPL